MPPKKPPAPSPGCNSKVADGLITREWNYDDILVLNVGSGELEKQLSAHSCGVVGFAWGMGGTNGQQVATIDKSGVLILWG
mmetsp:Transcript_2845/g.5503  ORF Transcript_2845/g.5503 Transcript_2845/m.5503 type:complete len:81 (-) Transcript_2845:87-329(-)